MSEPIEVAHEEMWSVWPADSDAPRPIAIFASEDAANRFASQDGVTEDDRIGCDLCVLHSFVEIVSWNNYKSEGVGQLHRASRLLGHGNLNRHELIASEQHEPSDG